MPDLMPTPKVRGLRTPNSALRALKKVIEGREDYVYKRPDGRLCAYVHRADGQEVPGCLIGHVLYEAGVPLEWLAGCDSGDFSDGDAGAYAVAEALGLPFAASRVLNQAQRAQDEGLPWGAAVAEASELAANL